MNDLRAFIFLPGTFFGTKILSIFLFLLITLSCLIIESLESNEKKTGTELHADLIQRRCAQIPRLACHLVKINSKKELLKVLDEIAQAVSQHMHPYLHFEVHGHPLGLVLSSGALVTWDELADKLRQINVPLKNGLFASFVTCYSGLLFGSILPHLPSPLFGYIGAWGKIYEDEFVTDFYDYFDRVLSGPDFSKIDFTRAVQALNVPYSERDSLPYTFQFGELIFDSVMEAYREKYKDKAAQEMRIDELITIVRSQPQVINRSDRELRTFFRNCILSGQIESQYKKIFLIE